MYYIYVIFKLVKDIDGSVMQFYKIINCLNFILA